jgi:hypothetical protein
MMQSDTPTTCTECGRELPNEFLEAIKKVLNYMYDTEADHYEECSEDEKKGHIFPHFETIKRFLDKREESGEPS